MDESGSAPLPHATEPLEVGPMADLTRRRFLTRASLGAAAGLAAVSGLALPKLISATADGSTAEAAPDLTPLGEDVVAHVRDASKGEIAVMSGNREVTYRDPQLVGRLLKAARQSNLEG